ncbi:MAG: bacillolysin, partial [Nocardioidaceae bacterium]
MTAPVARALGPLALSATLALGLAAAPASATKSGSTASTGTARVFMVNPVQSSGDESLTDQKDADYAALQPAYRVRPLTNLDGSGFLCGDWACVYSETGDPAYSTTNTFLYNRHDDRFEQVMAYYWITEAQKYIQSLGFGSTYPGVDNHAQLVRLNQLGYDNSFATDHPKYELRFGKGGVD